VRLAAVWVVLFAVYAVAPAGDGADEAHILAATDVLVSGGGLERAAERAEPIGVGFPLLLAPAQALAGDEGARLLVAAIGALALVLGGVLARRLAPAPWAAGAALLAGLSAPALEAGTAATPGLVAAALLAGGMACALATTGAQAAVAALGGALALAALPWLAPIYVLPAIPVAFVLVRSAARGGQRLVALVATEVMLGSAVFFVTLNEVIFGAPLPELPAVDVERSDVLGWAPLLALALAAGWLLLRSRREHLARVLPARASAEACAALALVTTAFAVPALTAALPALAALAAWSLRQGPRAVTMPLAALALLGGVVELA
jgi:hypothetical protein